MSLEEKKWALFLKRVRLFRFVPFTDFVIAAGSLATGELHKKSDFDVVVGVRRGRIFTNRFFAHLVFRLCGYGRRGVDHKENASDKICLNHFVTPQSYRLAPPHNAYWNNLYHKLVPVVGEETLIAEFFKSNDWLKPYRIYKRDFRYLGRAKSLLGGMAEFVLGGVFGDGLEGILGHWQENKIRRGFCKNAGYKPAFVCNKHELRFHMDTRRIEEMLKRGGAKG